MKPVSFLRDIYKTKDKQTNKNRRENDEFG